MRDKVDDLIKARRVFHQHHTRLCFAQRKLLGAAKAALKLTERADRSFFVDADDM